MKKLYAIYTSWDSYYVQTPEIHEHEILSETEYSWDVKDKNGNIRTFEKRSVVGKQYYFTSKQDAVAKIKDNLNTAVERRKQALEYQIQVAMKFNEEHKG